MAKLKNPLLSLGAIGRLAKDIVFTRRRRTDIAEKKPTPLDVKSLLQLSWRHMYQKAIVLWLALSPSEKQEWESLARPKHMTGYAYFISLALKPNPGLYLPLQGGTMSGDIDMAEHRLLKLPTPSDAQEAARLGDLATLISSLNNIVDVNVPAPTNQHFLYWNDGAGKWQDKALTLANIPTAVKVLSITFIIDGAGEAITTGQKGHVEIPFACTINQVTMLADQSGSIVVDIWKDSYANFPPTDADSITASALPTITTAVKSQDSTLSGWTKAIAAGAILAFNVDSCSTIERLTLSLKVTKS